MKIIKFHKKLISKHHQMKTQITISMDTNIKTEKRKGFNEILVREIMNVTVSLTAMKLMQTQNVVESETLTNITLSKELKLKLTVI